VPLTEEQVKALPGLTEEQASETLKLHGANELPRTRTRGMFAIAFGVVKEPMFLLLVACGVVYLVLGDI
jgi:Ca2+-transporting ATPase